MGTSNSVLTVGGEVRHAGRSTGVLLLGAGERPTEISEAPMPHVPPSRPGVVSGGSGAATVAVPRRVRVDGVKRSRPVSYAAADGKRVELKQLPCTLGQQTLTKPPVRVLRISVSSQ